MNPSSRTPLPSRLGLPRWGHRSDAGYPFAPNIPGAWGYSPTPGANFHPAGAAAEEQPQDQDSNAKRACETYSVTAR